MEPKASEALGRVAALGDVRRLVEHELDAAMRAARKRGVSLRDLAAALRVSPETVRQMLRKAE
jgi:Mn-dependent DtxR family transcriptional regulator